MKYAYPSTAFSYKFLSCGLSVRRKQKERREREVRGDNKDAIFLEAQLYRNVATTSRPGRLRRGKSLPN